MRDRKRWPRGTWMRLRSPDTLRALMKQSHYSLGDLADLSQCSKGFISHLLAGRRSSCTVPLADRIALALRVPTDVLFEAKMSTTDMSDGKSGKAA
jgi:transcriptional regulator with XRE-family HTH domain